MNKVLRIVTPARELAKKRLYGFNCEKCGRWLVTKKVNKQNKKNPYFKRCFECITEEDRFRLYDIASDSDTNSIILSEEFMSAVSSAKDSNFDVNEDMVSDRLKIELRCGRRPDLFEFARNYALDQKRERDRALLRIREISALSTQIAEKLRLLIESMATEFTFGHSLNCEYHLGKVAYQIRCVLTGIEWHYSRSKCGCGVIPIKIRHKNHED